MNILIPNATSPRNNGDQAILHGLLSLLQREYSDASITIHSSDPELYVGALVGQVKPHIYFWSVFEKTTTIVRIFRVAQVVLNYILVYIRSSSYLGAQRVIQLITDYKNADLIVFTGGGYLRTDKGITQSLNLLMLLFHFALAKRFSARKIVAPMSFGPFAHKWQERLSAKILQGFDIVAAREDVSHVLLQEYGVSNLILSSDHALLLKPSSVTSLENKNSRTIGFTIRSCSTDTSKKEEFEQAVYGALRQFAQLENVVIQPIIQVDGINDHAFDVVMTESIATKLKVNSVNVLPVKKISGVQDALSTYDALELLVGMRMHSNILAAIVGVPFVAISYEHKTDGIAKTLGMSQYVIPCKEVEKETLFNLILVAFRRRQELRKKLISKTKTIQELELNRWHHIFQNHA
ncbi:MAG: polysaccharide pyruvyl transferase family protein [Candidatus Roizmanbacteria bacterium]|nr:polysaccharide pyruvyl transferase family protein [Candidatus Roizmanbacteria bacterium]